MFKFALDRNHPEKDSRSFGGRRNKGRRRAMIDSKMKFYHQSADDSDDSNDASSKLRNILDGAEIRNKYLLESERQNLLSDPSSHRSNRILKNLKKTQTRPKQFMLSMTLEKLKPHPNKDSKMLVRLRNTVLRMIRDMKPKEEENDLEEGDEIMLGYAEPKGSNLKTGKSKMAVGMNNPFWYAWDIFLMVLYIHQSFVVVHV